MRGLHKLSDIAQGRDNNFNLIRMIAALAVLITHSFAIVGGSGDAEPLRDTLGMTLGSIAVDVFFVTSGFLVTASLLNRQSAIDFIWARALRIFPALWVMLLLTVFVLGPLLTFLPTSAYLSSLDTYRYLLKCASLVTGVVYFLPGVFEANNYRGAVNGSLWTMPYEIYMYLILVAAWLAFKGISQHRPAALKAFVVAVFLLAVAALVVNHYFLAVTSQFAKLALMFFMGAVFYVLRSRIILSRRAFAFILLALLLAAADKSVFFAVYTASIAYVALYLAYVPSGLVRGYNRLGDYSYGIYIYAFPVQQTVAALIPDVTVLQMILISCASTVVLAVLSWHHLERRALGLKSHYIGKTRRLLTLGPSLR